MDLQDPNNALKVVNTSVITSKSGGAPIVTVIGELRNNTNNKIDELVVEAKLTNSNGKVIDVISGPIYGLVIPAGQQVAFRLQEPAAADQSSYSGVKVRIISGESYIHTRPLHNSKNNYSPYTEILISWAPMILIILVWIVMAKKFSGKGSNQAKMLAALSEQNSLLEKQVAAIESIASASNKK